MLKVLFSKLYSIICPGFNLYILLYNVRGEGLYLSFKRVAKFSKSNSLLISFFIGLISELNINEFLS
jgi:hypothetical protein